MDGGRGAYIVRGRPSCTLCTPDTRFRVDERWKTLRNALAGLFCASLGSLDEQRTTSPTLTFQPEGDLPPFTSAHQLRHGTLPSEHVCTENLTPFLKLLPCKSLSGVARLLNPHRVFDADWHGMGVHVRYVRDAGVEVRLTFQAVLDPVRHAPDKRRGTISSAEISGAIDFQSWILCRLVPALALRSDRREGVPCRELESDSRGAAA